MSYIMGCRIISRHRIMICLIVMGGIAARLIGWGWVNTAPPAAAPGDDKRARPRPGPATPVEAFPLELAFSRRHPFSAYEKAAISPTGGHAAYTVVTPTKKPEDVWTLRSGLPIVMLGTRVHVTDIATGKTIALGTNGTNSFSPTWSPDGKKLAYYSDEGGVLRAWIFDIAQGKSVLAAAVRIKVHLYNTTVMPPTWSPDGHHLLVPALPADETDADPRPPHGRISTK